MGMDDARQLRIAVFGGSFNPVHNGHVAICQHVAARDLADQILVIPCFEHPFGKPLVAYEHRLRMCELALAPLPRVEVSTIERELGGVSYTARTVRALQSQHAAARYSLIVGSDIGEELASWRDADWLLTHVDCITLPRGANSPIPDVSASEIRQHIQQGKDVQRMVPGVIVSYVASHGLYREPAKIDFA